MKPDREALLQNAETLAYRIWPSPQNTGNSPQNLFMCLTAQAIRDLVAAIRDLEKEEVKHD